MKSIWTVVIAVILFSLMSTGRVSAQDDLRLTPEEFDVLYASAATLGKDGISGGESISIADIKAMESNSKKPGRPSKFDVSLAFGNAYGLGVKTVGKIGMNNAPAVEVRVGYTLSKYFEVIGGYSSADSFKLSSEYNDDQWHSEFRDSISLSALTIGLKAGVPVKLGKVSAFPYVLLGAGRASFKSTHSTKVYRYGSYYTGYNDKFKLSGNCDRIGIGAEVTARQNIRLFYEYSYLTSWLGDKPYLILYYSQVVVGGSVRF